jgi:hypothetical protein
MATKKPQLYLSGDAEADRLLSRDPLAWFSTSRCGGKD